MAAVLRLEHIAQLTYTTLQTYMDERGIDLAVGPLSDEDSNALCRAYGDLNWEYYLSTVGNDPDCFSLCIKFVKSKDNRVAENSPSGASLSLYTDTSKTFDIHIIENFVRDSENHPLRRKMVLYTLYAAVIFMRQVDGEIVRIIEPVPEYREYYSTFGFQPTDCDYVMSCSYEELLNNLEERSKSLDSRYK